MPPEKHLPPWRYNERLGPVGKVALNGCRDIPLSSISLGTTMVFQTAGWRSARPVYEDRMPPCVMACPAGENVEQWMMLAGQGRFQEAAGLLRRDNPLPATTGRVCFHPCQSECNRRDFDIALQIQAVERFIGELALDIPIEVAAKSTSKRVAVIGSGPAGLSFAYQALMAGIKPVVFEREVVAGGILATSIPEYRLPKKVLAGEIGLLKAAGIEFRLGTAVGKDVGFSELLKEYDAVFVACGRHKPRRPEIPGCDASGVLAGLSFLYNLKMGKRDEIGRRVVVVGGGNTAIDAARSALRLGRQVTLAYRRTRQMMPAIKEEVEEAEAEGVRMQFLLQPVEILVSGGHVSALRCQRVSLAEPDALGRRRPVPVAASDTAVECDTVILATGEGPDLDFLGPDVSLASDGSFQEPSGRPLEGVLAGGDVVSARNTVADAIASGKRAFWGISRYLAGASWSEELKSLPTAAHSLSLSDTLDGRSCSPELAHLDTLNLAGVERKQASSAPRRGSETLLNDFSETTGTLEAAGPREEAARCLHCGICDMCWRCFAFCPDGSIRPRKDAQGFDIDYEYCKGCGICVEECPCGAMKMLWEEK